MNKKKYIHVKTKYGNNYRRNLRKPKHKPQTIEDYDNLPFREPIKFRRYMWDWDDYKTRIDFYQPLKKYLKEKLGEDWNDLYSDILSKTKPKYRHILEEDINYLISRNIKWENEVPYNLTYWRRVSPIYGRYFIDKQNKIRYFEEEEDLLRWAKMNLIQRKLERILNEDF